MAKKSTKRTPKIENDGEMIEKRIEFEDADDICTKGTDIIKKQLHDNYQSTAKEAKVAQAPIENIEFENEDEKVKVKKGALVCEYDEEDDKFHTKKIISKKEDMEIISSHK